MRTIHLLRNFALLLMLVSCSDPSQRTGNVGFEYFPLQTGQFVELDVSRTNYQRFQPDETIRYLTRETIGDSFMNSDSERVFNIKYFSKRPSQDWKQDSIGVQLRTKDKILAQEGGKTIVRMRLPVSNGLRWNGNLLNNQNERIFEASRVGEPHSDTYLSFPNTITIIRQDDSTLLSRNRYIEIYARDVGLIRRERIYLQYCYTADCLGKGVINSGWREISIIQNHGKQ
ncbi:hypothetical protein [Dyadobacter bucti]|uniref:hypothetical protein n=1 Tax=Dyadobacter bucti TaxID=2572203 RepID=UPI001107FF4D|nr:hypothetical protein [Dyadobacter bucti]